MWRAALFRPGFSNHCFVFPSVKKPPAAEHGIKTKNAVSEEFGDAGKAFALLYDGFTIEQWVAYGKKKGKIATTVSKENGMLKRHITSILAGGPDDKHRFTK